MMKLNNNFATLLIITFFTCVGSMESYAQVTLKPGFRGGANFAHFTKGNDYYYEDDVNDGYSTRTAFYLGFYGALKLTKYYTLQPEINYSAQGSKYKVNNIKKSDLMVDYLSFGVINKFTFDRLNIHFGPTIDFVVDSNFNTVADVDLAFVLGMGFDVTKNLGIEARVKKGIIPAWDFQSNHSNVVFSLGATYTFDLK